MTTTKLAAALDAAAKGFRVFPVHPGSKIPAIEDWPDRATADETRLRAWWDENPTFNIGIATGGGIVVVDADTKDDRPGTDSLDMLDMMGLPGSLRVVTPSGGLHVYLRSDTEHSNRADTVPGYPGLDIRGERGYVLGPGSTIDGKPYAAIGEADIAVAPQWFDDLLLQARGKHTPHSGQPLVELDRPENVEQATQWLRDRAPEAVEGAGGDETTYRVACRIRDYGISEECALDLTLEHWNEAKASPPWQPDDLKTKIANAYAYASGGWGAATAAGEFDALDIDIGEPPKKADQAETLERDKKQILARPYAVVSADAIPRREWLGGGRHLIRKFVSVTVAPGNIGKSSLVIAETLAMVSGKPLLGHAIERPLSVWYWNLEDPYDELQRRIQAAMQHYGLTADDIGNRLFVNSGREDSLRIAIADKHGARIVRPVVDGFTAEMLARRIDVASIDPYVSSHGVPENDNIGMDMVAKEWGKVADRANAAVDLIHHTRKASGGDQEVTTDSARGGKALTDAARDVRVLNRMAKDEADKAGVENHRLYFRTYSDKANMSPPADKSEWFKLESVRLANGDDVGVVVPWSWPDPFRDITAEHVRHVQDALSEKPWRASVQAKDEWVGVLVAEATGLDLDNDSEKERVKQMVRDWTEKGWLVVRKIRDEKGKERPVIEAGKRLQETDTGA